MWIWMESHNGGGTRKQPGQGRYSNDSEWDGSSTSRGSFIMHNLYTKLRAEGGGHSDLKAFTNVQTNLAKINTNYIFFGAEQKKNQKNYSVLQELRNRTQNFFIALFSHFLSTLCEVVVEDGPVVVTK